MFPERRDRKPPRPHGGTTYGEVEVHRNLTRLRCRIHVFGCLLVVVDERPRDTWTGWRGAGEGSASLVLFDARLLSVWALMWLLSAPLGFLSNRKITRQIRSPKRGL